VIAEFSNYDELISALRQRAADLSLSGETMDAISGLPSRYSAKLLGPNRVRRLGAISLGPFLGALAVRCLIVEDKAALERLRRQTTPRNGSYARVTHTLRVVTDRQWHQIQKLGRIARWKKLSKAERSEIMRAVRAGKNGAR
jgi:hypothetical protein